MKHVQNLSFITTKRSLPFSSTSALLLCLGVLFLSGCCTVYDGQDRPIAKSTGFLRDVAYTDSVELEYLLPVTVTNASWIIDAGIPFENVMKIRASRTYEAKSTTASLIGSFSSLLGQLNQFNPL